MTTPRTTQTRQHTQEYITLREYVDLQLDTIEKVTHAARVVADKRLDALEDDIRSLRESRAELSGKASQTSVFITLVISLVSLLIGIIKLFGGP